MKDTKTEEELNFIDGIEFAIDYNLEISKADYERYCQLTKD